MRVLGIDCGARATGYGIIDTDGRSHSMVVAGAIQSSPKDPFPSRLARIAGELRELIRRHAPAGRRGRGSLLRRQRQYGVEAGAGEGVALLVIAEAGLEFGNTRRSRSRPA